MADMQKYTAGESQDLAYSILKLIRINNAGEVHANVLQLTLDQFAIWKLPPNRSSVDELLGTPMFELC